MTPSAQTNQDIKNVFILTAAILLIPLVTMQFYDDWNWGLLDFIVIGTLLVGTGLAVVLASRKIKSPSTKIAVIIAIVTALLLTWGELAVGIFGTPFAGS